MKIADQIYHCRIPNEISGVWTLRCHLRVFQPQFDTQAVMITDMGFEIGWFNPYIIETLATQIVNEFQLDPAKLVWLEYYNPLSKKLTTADFSQVTFEWCNGRATNPQWTAIAPDTVQALITEELQLA